jgi:hypothetical protein
MTGCLRGSYGLAMSHSIAPHRVILIAQAGTAAPGTAAAVTAAAVTAAAWPAQAQAAR